MFSSSDILLNDLLNHNERVSKISLSLCRALNLSEKITHDISKAAIFHDIGKLFIPDEVLHKPSPLNSIEFEIIKMHSTYSYEILKSHNYKESLCDIVKHHHENYDGSGYPDRLKGNDISLGARIVKICDVYDALISNRVYRSKFSLREAIDIMDNEKRTFDPLFYNIFKTNCLSEHHKIYTFSRQYTLVNQYPSSHKY